MAVEWELYLRAERCGRHTNGRRRETLIATHLDERQGGRVHPLLIIIGDPIDSELLARALFDIGQEASRPVRFRSRFLTAPRGRIIPLAGR